VKKRESKTVKFSLSERTDLPLLIVLDSMKKHEKSQWIKAGLLFFLLVYKEVLKRGILVSDMEKAIRFFVDPMSCLLHEDYSGYVRKKERLEKAIDELIGVFKELNGSIFHSKE